MNDTWPDGGQVTLKGDYGVATLVKRGNTIEAVLKCHNGQVIEESYTGRWAMNYGIAQVASAAAHSPGAMTCTESPAGICPHVEVT